MCESENITQYGDDIRVTKYISTIFLFCVSIRNCITLKSVLTKRYNDKKIVEISLYIILINYLF